MVRCFAVLAVTFGTLLTSIGYILIKKSHEKARKRKVSNILTIEFLLGLLVCLSSSVINVSKAFPCFIGTVSLAYADMIVLSALSGLTTVFNTLLAVLWGKEKITRHDYGCIIMTLLGAFLCVCFSNYNEVVLSTQVSYNSLLKSAIVDNG